MKVTIEIPDDIDYGLIAEFNYTKADYLEELRQTLQRQATEFLGHAKGETPVKATSEL